MESENENSPARYQAHCPICPWTGRTYASYGTAESAAREHAVEKKHRTHVTDQYKMRVVGSGFDQAGNPSGGLGAPRWEDK